MMRGQPRGGAALRASESFLKGWEVSFHEATQVAAASQHGGPPELRAGRAPV